MATAVGQELITQDQWQQGPYDVAAQLERWDLEQHLLLDSVTLEKLILDVVKEHVPGLNIADSIIDGNVIRDMTAASQVSLTVHDYGRAIVNHEGFYDAEGRLRTIDLDLDGLIFRLVGMEKSEDDVIITFEDRDINILRNKKGPRILGARRAGNAKKGITRAEAVLMLIRSVRSHRIPVRINELHTAQPIAKLTEEERHSGIDAKRTGKRRDKNRKHGFPAKFKMKDVSQAMLDNMTVALDEAERQMDAKGVKGDVRERVLLIMLVAGWGESGWLKSAAEKKYGTHKGVFQSDQIPADQLRKQAKYFTIGGMSFKKGGAIYAAKQKTWTVGKCAQWVEISDGQESYYNSFFSKARKVLDNWGGGSTSSTGEKTRRAHYEFKVDNRQTYWDAITNMAEEVNWRAFFSGGVFFYISEEDLFKSRARYRLNESDPGVLAINFKQDARRTSKTATARVRINRWAIPPGVCVYIEDLGPATGKWLVQSVERSLFSAEATLNLVQPLPEKVEPHPGYVSQKSATQAGSDEVAGAPIQSKNGVAPPLNKILAHSNGWTGAHGHDGVDLICNANAPIYAICDAKVIDVRPGGWWGKGNPGGATAQKGDGIIQLECLIDNGPFKKGMHFGYGHAEKATVSLGEVVAAGEQIGHAGFANAWHVHFMVNSGKTDRGVGDRDPWPYVQYAERVYNKRVDAGNSPAHTGAGNEKKDAANSPAHTGA